MNKRDETDERPVKKRKYPHKRKKIDVGCLQEAMKHKSYETFGDRVQSSLPDGDLSDWLQVEDRTRD
jgi:hypothetical protein